MGDAPAKAGVPKPRDSSSKKSSLTRYRRQGEKILHSKYIVICVIILTITDCALVIAELILDLYSVKKTLEASESRVDTFVEKLQAKYRDTLEGVGLLNVDHLFAAILQSAIIWNFNDTTAAAHAAMGPHTAGGGGGGGGAGAGVGVGVGVAAASEGYNIHPVPQPPPHLRNPSLTLHFAEGDNQTRRHKRDAFPYRDPSDYFMQDSGGGGDASGGSSGVSGGGGVGDGGGGRGGTGVGGGGGGSGGDLASDAQASGGNLLYHALQSSVGQMLHGNWTMNLTGVASSLKGSASGTATTTTSVVGVVGGNDVVLGVGGDSVGGGGGGGDGGGGDVHAGYSHVAGAASSGSLFYTPEHHPPEIEIAHKLHYASLAVVSVLLVEVILKMLCSGSHFVKRKIEVFDAVIIFASFVVDLVFLKGLADFPLDDSIFILAFLLPWRVIRVVNSLVVAVIDHEHVKLRLLYSRKKKLDKTVENLRNETDELKGLLQDVRSFCIKEGLEGWKIDNLLGKFAPRRRKDSKFYTLVKLVMSTASVADDKDSVSSSSIENDIRAIANRDSVLNLNDGSNSNDNTVNSFNFLGGYDSRSISMSSFRGGYSSASNSPNMSPSMSPVTSPPGSPSGQFLRVPHFGGHGGGHTTGGGHGHSAFRFDDTQSLTSEMDHMITSRPCTPNIMLTAPSMETPLCENEEAMAETKFGGESVGEDGGGGGGGRASLSLTGLGGDGEKKKRGGGGWGALSPGTGANGIGGGGGGGGAAAGRGGGGGKAFHKTAERHPPSPPLSPFLSVPNSHVVMRTGQCRVSDSHSLTDLQDVSSGSPRRSSCLSLNADAKGRRKKSPRRVNFDLS